MKSILTITLNPAVDKSCTVENIKPEKKLRCSPPLYEPGGGGINVSRGLIRLGINSTALFTAGGRTGELLKDLIIKEKVEILPIEVSGESRENFIVVDTSHNEQYRFGMPGNEISETEAANILNNITNFSPTPDFTIISGSLPPGIEASFLRNLVRKLKTSGVKIILDTSGAALSETIKEGVYLLKPNLGELSKLANLEALDNLQANEAAKKLIDENKAEVIIVSLGPQGALLVTKNESKFIPAPSVKKLSTVGAGDSMVAGIVSVLCNNGSLIDAARMGVACGSAATMNPGTGLFNKEDAERLFNWLKS